MGNRCFAMKPNHGCEGPAQLISVGWSARQVNDDAEMTLGAWYVAGERRKDRRWSGYFEMGGLDHDALWRCVVSRLRPRQPTWFYTLDWHTAAQLLGLWQQFDNDRFRLGLPAREELDDAGNVKKIKAWPGFIAIEQRPFCLFAVSTAGTLKVVDLSNYFDTTVSELLVCAGQSAEQKPCWQRTDDDHAGHAERLCRAVHQTVKRLIDVWHSEDRGNWQPTAGRLAMSNWRHEFMQDTGMVIDNDKMDRKFHRAALFGGETRAWKFGKIEGPVYHVDCCGLYGHVMANELSPVGIYAHRQAESPLSKMPPGHPAACIGRVRAWADSDLPVRMPDGRVVYPRGEITTTLAGPELAWAQKAGRIRAWEEVTIFKMGPAFQRYARYWWAMRLAADDAGDVHGKRLAKMMINSLSGKFSGRRPLWDKDERMPAIVRWGQWLGANPDYKPEDEESRKFCQWRALAGVTQCQTRREEKENSFPAVTAFITSSGRMYMRHIRSLLPDDSIVCQQTDSLLLTRKGYDALTATLYWNPDSLGCFRDVGVYDYVELLGPNHWTAPGKQCMAGLPGDAERTEYNCWTVRVPESTGQYVARGAGDNVCRIHKSEFRVRVTGEAHHDIKTEVN